MTENTVLNNLKTRFSCRKFKPVPVEREKLEAIIDAAKYAANGHHMEAWHFTIITSEEAKQELLDAVEVTVVGNRNCRHTELFGPFEKIFYGRLPIQNRVLGMDVKVYETHTAKITILPDTCNYSERRCETV